MTAIYDWLKASLEEEFRPVRVLRESARGTIRLLRHKTTGKQLVLRQFSGSPEVYEKLLDYRCPNLPTILEVARGPADNLVLEEYIQGDTLDLLLRGALFTQRETRNLVRQLCQSLWALHSLGAVHRDVKPENVILRGNTAVLIDFDAARIHKPELESDTQILGTTGYAAPEQYGLSQSDCRADIYSLGILINVMCTGQHPSIRLAEGRLGRVVERCTHVNPDRRYQNVAQLLEAL